ncbi:MAG: hypothetical protein KAH12_10900, partial [Anaerolineales bacterium]|nr:hypothetical protein [Anaerolineales bacterium]
TIALTACAAKTKGNKAARRERSSADRNSRTWDLDESDVKTGRNSKKTGGRSLADNLYLSELKFFRIRQRKYTESAV